VRQLLAKYNKARDLIQLGAYAPGHDNELDIAVQTQPQITALLQQDMLERAPLQDCQRRLMALAA
jgi:flagellum-specific ATP synthase